MELKFDWDEARALENLRKHGVSFVDGSEIFADPLSVTISDPLHSDDEDRLVIIGAARDQRILVVGHTHRDDLIRIINARRATPRERRHYMNRDYDEIRDDLLPEYDFSKGIRGKYYNPNVVTTVQLERDVAEVFTTAHQVNEALRMLIREGRVAATPSRHD